MAAAHTTVFELEGAKAQVLHLSYSFNRAVDTEKGQPVKVVRMGQISMTIRSDEKEMLGKILAWIGKQDTEKSGTITIYRDAEQTKELKKIQFENAYCVGYEEQFSSQGESDNTLETFRITAEKVEISAGSATSKFNMRWPDSES